ncbi:MAG TPA: hypothetical protein VGD67_14975, partial [Pseudonocardiaceae bacterium]
GRAAGAGVPLVLAGALVAGATASIPGAAREMRHTAARDYVENVRASQRLEPGLTLFDAPVPADAMLPLFGDNALASRALHGLGLGFDRPTGDLRMLDPTGTPRAVALVATVPAERPPDNGCGYPVRQQAVRIEFTEEVPDGRLVLRFGYFSQLPAEGTVSTPTQDLQVRFQAGAHALWVVVDGPFDEVLVRAEGAVCVVDAVAGLPLPLQG